MNPTAQQIDQAIGSVLDRLRAGGESVCQRQIAPFHVASQVITAGELERLKLDGRRHLAVLPHAVITPAARDWLKERQIELIRGGAIAPKATALHCIATSDELVPARWSAMWSARGVYLSQTVQTNLSRLASSVAEHALHGSLTLILTKTPDLMACLANRDTAVRAATVRRPGDVARVHAELGANVIALDPSAMSPYELQGIVAEASRLGAGRAPAVMAGDAPRRPK